MIDETYCKGCGKKINIMMFFGEQHQKFEDGTYCQKCALIIVEKNRRKL